jgi:fructose-6-phosphate aldolase 2
MLVMLDTADHQTIREGFEFFPLAGVTTNPSIVAKAKGDFWAIQEGIRDLIGEESLLFAQVVGETADEMVADAKALYARLGKNTYAKVPVTKEGLKAMTMIKKEGIGVLATAIFTPLQALLAARAGADWVAPYVNRIDNITGDGVGVIAAIRDIYDQAGIDTKIVAASFKNAQQVLECAKLGAEAVTVPGDILEKMLEHLMTDWSMDQFDRDWKAQYGNRTILQL